MEDERIVYYQSNSGRYGYVTVRASVVG